MSDADTPTTMLSIVRPQSSQDVDVDVDVVETLAFLLQEAKEGRLTGISYAAVRQDKSFIVDAAGESYRNPVRALGEVHMLADELTRRLRAYPE